MNQTDNKIVDVAIILALPVFYSLASGKAYAEALGFSIAEIGDSILTNHPVL